MSCGLTGYGLFVLALLVVWRRSLAGALAVRPAVRCGERKPVKELVRGA